LSRESPFAGERAAALSRLHNVKKKDQDPRLSDSQQSILSELRQMGFATTYEVVNNSNWKIMPENFSYTGITTVT